MSDIISVNDAVFRFSRRRNPIGHRDDGYLTILLPSSDNGQVVYPAQSITIYVGSGNLSELATWLENKSNELLAKELRP